MSHTLARSDSPVITKIERLTGRKAAARFSIRFCSGAELKACLLQRTEDGRRWTVLPPKIPLLNEAGELVFDGAGRLLYESAVSFANGMVREHFVQTCLQAIQAQHPYIASVQPERRPRGF
jgi:hypothetical protein